MEKFKALVVATGAMLKRRKEELRGRGRRGGGSCGVVEDEASGKEI